jgi:hypothetical protein
MTKPGLAALMERGMNEKHVHIDDEFVRPCLLQAADHRELCKKVESDEVSLPLGFPTWLWR